MALRALLYTKRGKQRENFLVNCVGAHVLNFFSLLLLLFGLPLERRCPADLYIWTALRAWIAIDRAAVRSPLGFPPITRGKHTHRQTATLPIKINNLAYGSI